MAMPGAGVSILRMIRAETILSALTPRNMAPSSRGFGAIRSISIQLDWRL
jgi:hypothetical protein